MLPVNREVRLEIPVHALSVLSHERRWRMKLKAPSRISWVVTTMVLSVFAGGLAASQQAKENPVPPERIPPAPTPAIQSPAPTKSPANLTFEERADIFMARKSYADAVNYYKRALQGEGRGRARLWNKLGISYQISAAETRSDQSAARKAYKEAIRRDKTFAEPWNNLGTTYYLENRAGKSLKYYRRAIQLNPTSASFHLNLGTSLYLQKRVEEAIEEYRLALKYDPNVLTEHSSVGTVVQTREAEVKYFLYLAKALASMGRAEEAVRYLRRAFEDGFHDTEALDRDKDFMKISGFPAYVELRANPPQPIRD